ncbi:MAG: MFS transporter [Alphaproteobacteria bacterium]|nr:MFS transporter [Alphaproteobacteria bacterium]
MPPGRAALSLLADRAFRRIWLTGVIVGTIRWLEFLAVSLYVLHATGSAFQVAFFTFLRLLPVALLGAVAGAVAERVSARRVLLWLLALGVGTSAGQALLAAGGALQLWHVAAGALLNGLFWATDLPLRRTMLGEIAGPQRTAAAMALDTATNNATRMLGPVLGGLLLETGGIEGGFLLGALLYAVALGLIAGLSRRERVDRASGMRLLARLIEGFRLVGRDPAMVGTLAVTVIFNLLAWPTTALVPVIAEHDLGLSAFLVGLLVSADGLGALAGALLMATLVRPRQFRAVYLGGVAFYAIGTLLFAFSPWPVLSGLLLVLVGAGNASFASMQATIVFLSAPAAARPRVMGVLAVCIGSSAFGFALIGLLASQVGAQAAIVLCSLGALLALALAALAWPAIRPGAPPPDAVRTGR